MNNKLNSAIVRNRNFEPTDEELETIKKNIGLLVAYASRPSDRDKELELAIIMWRNTHGESKSCHWAQYKEIRNKWRKKYEDRGEKSEWFLRSIAPKNYDWTDIERKYRALSYALNFKS